MRQLINSRLGAFNTLIRKIWNAERIPCWTEYLHQTSRTD